MQLQTAVLQYLASEEFCSEFEIEQVVLLNDGSPEEAKRMLAAWLEHGWIEHLGGDGDLAPLIHLTERAYIAHPSLSRAT